MKKTLNQLSVGDIKAFSLIEVLTVIGLMGLIMGISFVFIPQNRCPSITSKATDNLIQSWKNRARSLSTYNDDSYELVCYYGEDKTRHLRQIAILKKTHSPTLPTSPTHELIDTTDLPEPLPSLSHTDSIQKINAPPFAIDESCISL